MEPAHGGGGLGEVLVILAAAVAAVLVFRRLRITPVLGYLAAGYAVGPHGLGLVETGRVAALAELGVVFLLFAVGLELSFERLSALRRHVFGLGTVQVAATGTAIAAALAAAGLGWQAAVVLGGGLALSSTAVVLQMLGERRELATPAGRIALSVLLLQDLAVVPLLTVVPLLGGAAGGGAAGGMGSALLKAAAALALIVFGGRLVLRPLLRRVAQTRAPELFTGVALLVVLGVGWLTAQAGLSMALGAFLAGLLIAETEYRHQVEGDILPFRGLLLALFFMTVGMEVDVSILAARPALVLGGLAGLLAVKAGAAWAACRLFGVEPAPAVRVALSLAQAGEFGFVLFSLAVAGGALDRETAAVAVLVVALSMTATPLLFALGARAARRLERAREGGAAHIERQTREMARHVLIAGFGRSGRTLARLLEARGAGWVALDVDAARVEEAHAAGLPVYFGDASRREVLRAAGIHRAAAAVVTLDDPRAAGHALAALRAEVPEVPVLVRARDATHSRELGAAGATRVVPELVEGSLRLGGALLEELGEPADAVERLLDEFREEAYARLEDLGSRPA
ncbi:MAG TPA: monovalent cation:proton antiporter-2 (CPA2) family protein [Longimicrobium sp.]|nr:monovalent cation:proton antiporter-2 (CPA2) family protein [Longimicrobium sp.]